MNYEPAIVIAIIVALGEVLKGLKVPSKFLPFINIIFGIGIAFALSYNGEIVSTVFEGLVYGLSASGLYDVGLKPMKKVAVNNK